MIKPCPFCGDTAIEVVEGSTFRWLVATCLNCGASAGEVRVQTLGEGSKDDWSENGKKSAIEEWNTRA